jgi:multicomponent Na+:H+ antiporter subunit E
MESSGDPVRRDGPGNTLRVLAASALVFVFWLVISASLAPADLALGAALSLLLGGWSARFLWAGAAPRLAWRDVTALLLYLPAFVLQMFKAALHVARLVLDPRLPIEPRLVVCRTRLRRELARVAFAQAVTLTPGTLTVDMKDGDFLVHCLDEASAHHLLDGRLESEIARIFDQEAP